MQAFGISHRDLQRAMSKSGKVRGKAKALTASKVVAKRVVGKIVRKAGAKVAAKYLGPNSEVWNGRGLTPRWLAALVKQGHKKEDFAVKG